MLGYEPLWAETFTQQVIAWRAVHSQGRGLFSVLLKNLPDIDSRTVREGEMVFQTLSGFRFGDGHLHNEDLIQAVQDEADFEPGEFIVVWVESQPIHRKVQEYKVIDATLGVAEEPPNLAVLSGHGFIANHRSLCRRIRVSRAWRRA